jgi:RNA polymerase sigma-70 factor, ECF subfamily
MNEAIAGTEQDILERATKGDPDAFADIVNKHRGMVFSLAYNFIHDRGVAEELAQEVFLSLYRNLPSIKSPVHLVFWLRKVAGHRCLDQARRQKLRPQVALDQIPEPAIEMIVPDVAMSATLRRLIADLPEKARLVLVLRYQEDLEPLEIARTLNMPVNTVKSHLRRSLIALREKLECPAEKQYEQSRRTTKDRIEPGRAISGLYRPSTRTSASEI